MVKWRKHVAFPVSSVPWAKHWVILVILNVYSRCEFYSVFQLLSTHSTFFYLRVPTYINLWPVVYYFFQKTANSGELPRFCGRFGNFKGRRYRKKVQLWLKTNFYIKRRHSNPAAFLFLNFYSQKPWLTYFPFFYKT